jgi:hypothetical protein
MRDKIQNILLEAIMLENQSNINDAFWKWFGDSKVVDQSGNPLIMYHGTVSDFDSFHKGLMYFTSDAEYANVYAIRVSQQGDTHMNVIPVYLSIKNPFDTRKKRDRDIFKSEFYMRYGTGTDLDIDRGFPDWTDAIDLLEFFDDNGYNYDGLVLAESHGRITYAIFNPTQAKSIFNRGTWNPNDKDIIK